MALAALSLVAVGCGSNSKSSSSSSAAGASTAGFTVDSANVPGVGKVLVNAAGHTMYVLSSEAGGKITCVDSNGCTKYWPDSELPKGVTAATAGSGVDASKLGTAKNAGGDLYVTYGGYPLYTFAGDSASGMAKGEGVNSFGGTWMALGVDGTPVQAATSGSTPTTAYSGGGY